MMNEWGLASPDPTFGQGTTLQSACPAFPSAPEGYVVWNTNVNGAVPADVQARAVALTKDPAKTLGYTETIYSGGVPLLLRVDPHTWSTDAQAVSRDAMSGFPRPAQAPQPSQRRRALTQACGRSRSGSVSS